MSQAWKDGSTRRWRGIRLQVLVRDGYRCRINLDVCTGEATQAHHIHGRGRCPGCRADLLTHLVAACQPCNGKTGDPGAQASNPRPKAMTKWRAR